MKATNDDLDTQAVHDDQWRRAQRHEGYVDGLRGIVMGFTDHFYGRGYWEGTSVRLARLAGPDCELSRTPEDSATRCPYRASQQARHARVDGPWLKVCGIHAKMLARCGYTVRSLGRKSR